MGTGARADTQHVRTPPMTRARGSSGCASTSSRTLSSSAATTAPRVRRTPRGATAARGSDRGRPPPADVGAVSYTHLTLPTICSV
eukprot:6380063-Prymnesium_polylepis.1